MKSLRVLSILPLTLGLSGCGLGSAGNSGQPDPAEQFKAERALSVSAETLASVWGGSQGEQTIELTFAVQEDGQSGTYALAIGEEYLGGSFEIDAENLILFDGGSTGRGKLTGSNTLHLVYAYESELYDVELSTR